MVKSECRNLERTILHCDLNGFYASVECALNPALKEVPMAVGGNPENRHGIILAKNELAKKYNVKTAETIWQAKRKCPDLVMVAPHHGEYARYSRLVNQIYAEFTDLIEPFGIDESWLDVTAVSNLFGSGPEIADKLRTIVKERLDLTISVGVSFNKIFAKLGSDYKKPDATTVISRENYKELVFPLPVSDLLYVGKIATEVLRGLNIRTIGQLAASDKGLVSAKLGKMGEMIHDYANGRDDSPVKPAAEGREVKSVGNGMTFKRDLVGFQDIKTGVWALADEVAGRMRKYGVKCHVVQVLIKDPNFKSISRQRTLSVPTYLAKEIADTSMEIIRECWNENAPIRMLTITGANLTGETAYREQLSFLEEKSHFDRGKQEKLENTLDEIRQKYGKKSVELGGILKNDIGVHD